VFTTTEAVTKHRQKNPFSTKNQTLTSYIVYISPTK